MRTKILAMLLAFVIFTPAFLVGCENPYTNNKSLTVPRNFSLESYSLSWDSDTRAEFNKVYVKRPGQDFVFIPFNPIWVGCIPFEGPRNFISIAALGLGVGENVVRVVSGWNSKNDNGNFVYDTSPAAEYTIIIDRIEEEPIDPPELWLHEGGIFGINYYSARVYLKRPGEDFVELDSNLDHGVTFGSSIDLPADQGFIFGEIPPSRHFVLTDLSAGEYVIQIIAVDSYARLQNGVLVNYTESLPAYFYLEVDTEGEFVVQGIMQTLPPPTNLRSSDPWNFLWAMDCFTIRYSKVYIKRPGQDFEYVAHVENYPSLNYNSIRWERLGLTQGSNTIRVVAIGGMGFVDGVLYYFESPPAEYTIDR
jgi:hypothetical protein